MINGEGFNGAVNNLDFLGGTICATGDFTNMLSNSSNYNSQFCITFSISGYNVSAVYLFDGGSGSLAYQIPGYDLIKNNGGAFLVGAGQNSYAGADYFFQVSPTCIPSPLLATNLTSQIYSFIYTSGIVYAVSSGGYYYTNGALTATIPFSPYLFLASWSGVQYFNNQGVGTQWAFNGSIANQFALQGGRTIKYVGGTFSGGVNCPVPELGYNLLLNWDGSYYIVVGTPQSVGAWTFF